MFNDIHKRTGSKLTSDFSFDNKLKTKIPQTPNKETYPKPTDIQNMIQEIKKKEKEGK